MKIHLLLILLVHLLLVGCKSEKKSNSITHFETIDYNYAPIGWFIKIPANYEVFQQE